ncbi:MAG: hypothetical protein JNM50_02315 [Chromatiales bacterium]|nr:hypothetical protein [Chromatiales bacterium]
MNGILRLAILGSMAALGACTTYYKVTDPTSQKVYYTTEVDQQKGGSVSLKDASSGAQVTIQNSEVVEISSDEYKTATAKPKK